MKTFVIIKNQKIEANVYGSLIDTSLGNREIKEVRASMTYDQAKALFVDDVPWSIVQEYDPIQQADGRTITPEPMVYDNSEFCMASSITDHRDGTVTVKMGKLLPGETLEILAGRPVKSVAQAKAMRMQVERTYQTAAMTTDERMPTALWLPPGSRASTRRGKSTVPRRTAFGSVGRTMTIRRSLTLCRETMLGTHSIFRCMVPRRKQPCPLLSPGKQRAATRRGSI